MLNRLKLQKRFLCVLAVLCFAVAMVLFSGCDDKPKPGPLNGVWTSTVGEVRDIYTITGKNLKYVSGFGDDYDYSGTIEVTDEWTDYAGVLIIKYTKAPKYDGKDAPGNYQGIYFKELTAQSVQIAAAYLAGSGGVETKSLEDAIEKFTKGNSGIYAKLWGTYTK